MHQRLAVVSRPRQAPSAASPPVQPSAVEKQTLHFQGAWWSIFFCPGTPLFLFPPDHGTDIGAVGCQCGDQQLGPRSARALSASLSAPLARTGGQVRGAAAPVCPASRWAHRELERQTHSAALLCFENTRAQWQHRRARVCETGPYSRSGRSTRVDTQAGRVRSSAQWGACTAARTAHLARATATVTWLHATGSYRLPEGRGRSICGGRPRI